MIETPDITRYTLKERVVKETLRDGECLSNFISLKLWASFKEREWGGELVYELLGYKEPESRSACIAFGKKPASVRGESQSPISDPFPKKRRTPKQFHCFLLGER